MKVTLQQIKDAAKPCSYMPESRWDIPLELARHMTDTVIEEHSFDLVNIDEARGTAHLAVTDWRPKFIEIDGHKIACDNLITTTGKGATINPRCPTETFWELWKENKSAVKAAGLTINKIGRQWSVGGDLGAQHNGALPPKSVAEKIESKLNEARRSSIRNAKIKAAQETGISNPKSELLIALKVEMDSIGEDYSNPRRSEVIGEFFDELDACGRVYFDDRLDGWGIYHGRLYGEQTMIDMLEDGTFCLDERGNLSNDSVQEHCAQM